MRRRSSYRTARLIREETLSQLVQQCRNEFAIESNGEFQHPTSAIEHVLRREASELAKIKNGDSRGEEREMIDELCMFLVRGP